MARASRFFKPMFGFSEPLYFYFFAKPVLGPAGLARQVDALHHPIIVYIYPELARRAIVSFTKAVYKRPSSTRFCL